jgi:phosphohistidine swiveling domain-containing protein
MQLIAHAVRACVAREFGVPAVVNVRGAMDIIADGAQLQVDGDAGVVRLKTAAAARSPRNATGSHRG